MLRSIFVGGEGPADWDTVGSNCSTGNRLSSFNKRTSSKSSDREIRARKARIQRFEHDEGLQPHRPPFRHLAVVISTIIIIIIHIIIIIIIIIITNIIIIIFIIHIILIILIIIIISSSRNTNYEISFRRPGRRRPRAREPTRRVSRRPSADLDVYMYVFVSAARLIASRFRRRGGAV